MDNAQKAIMIGVGLFITIIIIGAVMMITGLGTDMLNQSKSKAEGLSAALDAQLTAEYDQTEVTGSNVLAAITRYTSDSNMFVAVYNTSTGASNPASVTPTSVATKTTYSGLVSYSNGRYTTNATPTQQATQPTYGTYSTSTGACYIPSTATYKAFLVQNSGVTVGIVFLKK